MRKKMNRIAIPLILCLVLVASILVLGACGKKTETTGTTVTGATEETTGTTLGGKDTIVIGAARGISGVSSFFEENAFGPAYKLWVDDVNADGGIYVAEYGKKLPVEMKVYDDTSDMDTSMRLLTKLMEEDHVDFVFAPTSTAFLFAAAGVTSAHNYILMSAEGGATTLEPKMLAGDLPYFFQCLSYSNHNQMPALGEICRELGVTTAAVLYIDDLHGIEYSSQANIFLADAGVDIVMEEAIPAGIADVSTILRQVEELNPDLVCSFQYPPENILTVGQMIQLNINPKALLLGPGGSFQFFANIFGPAMEGIMFEGAWSVNSSPDAQAYYDHLKEYMGSGDNIDFWGAIIYRAELEFFQQAIEEAGTLNQDAIAEVMRTAHFSTVMSPDTFFTNQMLDNSCYMGQIGQWQGGVAQVIDVGDKRTAEPIYPKPAWPAP
jgi:branched-chain amino acid transport system substrate-binding protein